MDPASANRRLAGWPNRRPAGLQLEALGGRIRARQWAWSAVRSGPLDHHQPGRAHKRTL